MNEFLVAYGTFAETVGYVLFGLAVIAAIVALVDWAVRTRRISPFSGVARFFRRFVDPLMTPVERRVVRSGGQPSSAPWWTLVIVVVGGLLLTWLLGVFGGILRNIVVDARSPVGLGKLVVGWTFMILRAALIVRVVSSWVQISPYSKWIRWSYTLTEWMLAPLRRIVPLIGPVDITPIIAFVLLSIAQGIVGSVW